MYHLIRVDLIYHFFVVPEDQLIPGRRVFTRSPVNVHNYDPGFVMNAVSSMIIVALDSSLPLFIDPKDIAAIVIDKVPDPEALHIGSPVIAKRPKETSSVEGKLLQIKWENGQRLFLVEFWDGTEHWNNLENIRVMTTIKAGGISIVIVV